MKKLLNTALLFFVCATLIGVNCFGQPPKTDAELLSYAEQKLKPKINDSLIAKHFKDADIVVEGIITNVIGDKISLKTTYELSVCRIFKGDRKQENIKIIANAAPYSKQESFPYGGEWSHEAEEVGIFFIKKNGKSYNFINPAYGWISYPDHISPFRHEKLLSSMLYGKIMTQQGAFCHKTAYFNKKKDFLSRSAKGVNSLTILGFSKDTIPAGILTGASTVQIIGQGFGTAKGQVHLPDANNGGLKHFRLHSDRHINFWSDTLIEINVPSKGYFSDSQNGLGACAGSGIVHLYKAVSLGGGFTESIAPLIIPYAVNNVAEYANNPEFYTPYEVHLRNANGAGGYTFVYDTSFYNNRLAMAAFRRALETWRCATGIHFKQECASYNLCQNDESSTRILVSFAQPCFQTSNNHVLATTHIVAKFDVGCQQYLADSITMAFQNQSNLVYNPDPSSAATSPAVWNYGEANNSSSNAYNFERVALHEIGHILMLQHVIDTNAIMYWKNTVGMSAIANHKTIDPYTLEGISYVLNRDAAANACVPITLLPPAERCNTLPACSDYCPTPDPNIPLPDFAVYYSSDCSSTTIDALQTGVKEGQQKQNLFLKIHTINVTKTTLEV